MLEHFKNSFLKIRMIEIFFKGAHSKYYWSYNKIYKQNMIFIMLLRIFRGK